MKNHTAKFRLLILAILAVSIISCSEKQLTQDEIVKNNAEEYLKSNMNDPESYELVKIELIDSVLFSDNIRYRKDMFTIELTSDQLYLELIEETSKQEDKEVKNLKTKIERNKNILFKIDSLETQLGARKNEVASYTYLFKFRGNNAFGAKVLNEFILQTNPAPDFKVINMTDNKDKIILNPNDFPGYREMIKKN